MIVAVGCVLTAGAVPDVLCIVRKDRPMNFDFLFTPAEELDAWLEGFFAGAPLLTALGIAFLLGLRHASDPDHLVAVTSLVAADDGDTRGAARSARGGASAMPRRWSRSACR